MEIRKILLATDFSSGSRLTFAPVADLARRLEASIELVNCMMFPWQYTPAGLLTSGGPLDELGALHRRNLELEAADPSFSGLQVSTRFLEGVGADTVHASALQSGTDLIVQSSRGLTGLKRLLLGSFAEQMLRVSNVPVLTFKWGETGDATPSRQFRPRRILFPYDFSSAARTALETVRFLGITYGATVEVLYAWSSVDNVVPLYGAGGMGLVIEPVSNREEFTGRLLNDLREFSARELNGLEHEEEVVAGDPSAAILTRAAENRADLICMSTHGWTGLKKMFLGSVAEKVLRGSPCPTWIVRTPEADLKD